MSTKIKFTGKELAEKLGIEINDLPKLRAYGHSFVQPIQIFDQTTEIAMPKEDYDVLIRVENEKYNTGEIWNGAYDIMYLYLGKVGEQDIIITLGGDTPYASHIERPKEGVSKGPCQFISKVFPR